MVSSGGELFHRNGRRGLQNKKDRQKAAHRVKAIRNWILFRERARMTLQSINCGDQFVAVEDLKQPVQ